MSDLVGNTDCLFCSCQGSFLNVFQDDFAMALTDLFLEKMEERSELIAKLWTSKTAGQSEIRVDNT